MRKKLLFSAAVLIAASTFTSCKKDYTCECTTTAAGYSATASVTINTTKAKAKDACNATATSMAGYTTTCAIK